MNKTLLALQESMAMCDTHAARMSMAFSHIQNFIPVHPETFKNLHDDQIGFFELLMSRFAKLQDTIGQRVFIQLLRLLGEDVDRKSFLDCLHRLEKLGYLDQVDFWLNMREIRNSITHDYPDHPEFMAEQLNKAINAAALLLDYWKKLKEMIMAQIQE